MIVGYEIWKGNEETAYLEEQLGIEQELKFEFNEEKKFNCLTEPVPYCLSDAKGRPSTINKMEGRDSRNDRLMNLERFWIFSDPSESL